MKSTAQLKICSLLFVSLVVPVAAQTFEIDSFTIDTGGQVFLIGQPSPDGFELSGTVAQPDAGLLASTGFILEGGFWFGNAVACPHLADMNSDLNVNGLDIQRFVDCQLGLTDTRCTCADMDENEIMDEADVQAFIATLLAE